VCLSLYFVHAGAVSGIVLDPYRGGRAHGVRGLLKGVLTGITGAAVKPVVGVLDAATFGYVLLHSSFI
jgi:hypothetical protein